MRLSPGGGQLFTRCRVNAFLSLPLASPPRWRRRLYLRDWVSSHQRRPDDGSARVDPTSLTRGFPDTQTRQLTWSLCSYNVVLLFLALRSQIRTVLSAEQVAKCWLSLLNVTDTTQLLWPERVHTSEPCCLQRLKKTNDALPLHSQHARKL